MAEIIFAAQVGGEPRPFEQRKTAAAHLFQHVVADDRSNAKAGDAEVARDSRHALGRRQWIGRAHVGDDADASGGADRQHRLEPRDQQRIVAGIGTRQPFLLGERDGALGEALEAEIGDVAFRGEFHGRVDPVARVAGAGAYADGLHGALPAARYRPGRATGNRAAWPGRRRA